MKKGETQNTDLRKKNKKRKKREEERTHQKNRGRNEESTD